MVSMEYLHCTYQVSMRCHVMHIVVWILLLVSQCHPKSVIPKEYPLEETGPVDAKGAEELWLEDYTNRKTYLQEMQSDSAFGQLPVPVKNPQCPPPPRGKFQEGCHMTVCKSDKECGGERQKCCNNGCVFTCMETMPSPPVVDWLREPPRRINSGMSWLVPGPELPPQVETCTTSMIWEDDEDPLLCPQGYVCHIEDLGDPANGIPNSGRCIKEHNDQSGNGRPNFHFRLKVSIHEQGGCAIEKGKSQKAIIPNGSTFPYHKHICECHQGAVTCIVGRPRGRS